MNDGINDASAADPPQGIGVERSRNMIAVVAQPVLPVRLVCVLPNPGHNRTQVYARRAPSHAGTMEVMYRDGNGWSALRMQSGNDSMYCAILDGPKHQLYVRLTCQGTQFKDDRNGSYYKTNFGPHEVGYVNGIVGGAGFRFGSASIEVEHASGGVGYRLTGKVYVQKTMVSDVYAKVSINGSLWKPKVPATSPSSTIHDSNVQLWTWRRSLGVPPATSANVELVVFAKDQAGNERSDDDFGSPYVVPIVRSIGRWYEPGRRGGGMSRG